MEQALQDQVMDRAALVEKVQINHTEVVMVVHDQVWVALMVAVAVEPLRKVMVTEQMEQFV